MKALKQLFYFSCVISMALCLSCSAEDGMDGVDGAQGIQGVPGQDGVDGQDGMDGTDGVDGQDGQDGQDGNANVMGVTVDPFPSWTEGTYLGQEANFVELDEPALTEAVVADALVLVYFQLTTGDIWYPMTYAFTFDNGNSEVITYTYEPTKMTIYALRSKRPLNASISKVRYFIIPTSQSTSSSSTSREVLIQDLEDKGVDVTSYEAVAEYFDQE